MSESNVPTLEFLVGDLLPDVRIVPAVSGVDDDIAVVLVILTATRHDNFRPRRRRGSRDEVRGNGTQLHNYGAELLAYQVLINP